MQQIDPRPDPSPSRLAYRAQRWLLTPGIRWFLRFGLPVVATLMAAALYFADQDRRDAAALWSHEMVASVQERPEFMVRLMVIDGAGPGLTDDIREVLALDFPASSFDLDLMQIKTQISGLDPVATAAVRIRPGNILEIEVTERQPALVWRTRDGLAVLDASGTHIGEIEQRGDRGPLPLIAGENADLAAAEALEIYAVATPLHTRMRGLVRMGERRWDVVLDRRQRVLLPEKDPVQALERVIAFSQTHEMLERDVTVVDVREPGRPTLRMSETAVQEWWQIRRVKMGGRNR